jgi:hypothetical protein
MKLYWREIIAAVALCAVNEAAGQDNVASSIMRTQIRSVVAADAEADLPEYQAGEPILLGNEWEALNDPSVEPAAWLQQPGRTPSLATNQPTVRRAATASRLSSTSLASVPNMFGDCGMTTANVTIFNTAGKITSGEFMLPMVGGSRTAKMAENDIAMPVDRIFFGYNHYTDLFQMQTQPTFPSGAPGQFRQEPIDRYTMGVEKTFFNTWTSVELRMPFNGSFNATLPSLGVSNGSVGNLAVILKGLLYRGQSLGIGAGLGIDTPTGSDTVARLGTVNLRFQNQAAHLLPYLGFLYAPGDPQWGWGNGLFMTGFLQADVATSGNNIQFVDPASAMRTSLGKFNEQNLLFADLSVGYWLYRNPFAERWTGFAVVGEAHYTTSLQDPDLVAGTSGGAGAAITNTSGRFDIVNGTIALQALMFDASSLRVGGVFPMGSRQDQRMFDAELQVQFNRRF